MGLAFVSAQSLSFLKSWNVLRPYIYAVYICIKSSDVQSFWIVKFLLCCSRSLKLHWPKSIFDCTREMNKAFISYNHTWWNSSESIIKLILSIRVNHKTDEVLQNRSQIWNLPFKAFHPFSEWNTDRCISPVVLSFLRCFRILANSFSVWQSRLHNINHDNDIFCTVPS